MVLGFVGGSEREVWSLRWSRMEGPFPDPVVRATAQSLLEAAARDQKDDGGLGARQRKRWPWPGDGGSLSGGGLHQTSEYEALL